MSLALHGIQCEELRTQPAQALRQAQRADEQVFTEQFGDRLAQQFEPLAIARRQPYPLGLAITIALDLRLDALDQIDLVVYLEHRQLVGADLAEYRHDLFDLLVALRLMGVDHVQQQIGVARLFQGRPECLHQLVRQMADETHRVGQHHRTKVIQFQTPQGRVESGE